MFTSLIFIPIEDHFSIKNYYILPPRFSCLFPTGSNALKMCPENNTVVILCKTIRENHTKTHGKLRNW